MIDVKNIINELNDSMKLINSVGQKKFAEKTESQRAQIESILHSSSPFSAEDILQLVMSYTIILNESFSSSPEISEREKLEHLIAACISVGYITGMGFNYASILPIAAASGTHLELAEKIFTEFSSLPKK